MGSSGAADEKKMVLLNEGSRYAPRMDGEELEKVVKRMRGGDPLAFEEIVKAYEREVFHVVHRHIGRDDVEGVCQETFLAVYRGLDSIRDLRTFPGWIRSIAVRKCYDHFRERYRRHEIPVSRLSEETQDWVDRATSATAKEQFQSEQDASQARELIDAALSQLSPEDRMVVALVALEERPVAEAAKLLGWSVANVKVRSFRARKKLRTILESLMKERTGLES